MKIYGPPISKTERAFLLLEKRKNQIQSPDTTKMQEVDIDGKTKIYIPLGASVDEARIRYDNYVKGKKF